MASQHLLKSQTLPLSEKLFVVSGLARGIDTAAHIGGLETETIAVVAGGDLYYLSGRKQGPL